MSMKAAVEAGGDPGELEAGQAVGEPAQIERIFRHHALTAVAGLDDDEHLVSNAVTDRGVGERPQRPCLGVETVACEGHHIVGLAEGRQA